MGDLIVRWIPRPRDVPTITRRPGFPENTNQTVGPAKDMEEADPRARAAGRSRGSRAPVRLGAHQRRVHASQDEHQEHGHGSATRPAPWNALFISLVGKKKEKKRGRSRSP